MKVETIGNRGLLFPFKDPFLTNVYVILGNERVYVLDTFLGIDSMVFVKREIREQGYDDLPVVVFNSHGDYDHYWGNAAFEDALIIGHELCRERILKEHEEAFQANEEQKKGDVILKPPSLVFTQRLSFPGDEITFYHTPGHTTDSATCWDNVDKVLFVGDNVETPLPYVYNTDLGGFHSTLESFYRIFDWKVMIGSHAPALYNRNLLDRNIKYLESLKDWNIDLSSLTKDELHLHIHNIKYLAENIDNISLREKAELHLEEMKKFTQH
ncbi:MAG: MBL fold metallo-hydrolase [Candidatus Thorarchaeota archaeon]